MRSANVGSGAVADRGIVRDTMRSTAYPCGPERKVTVATATPAACAAGCMKCTPFTTESANSSCVCPRTTRSGFHGMSASRTPAFSVPIPVYR